MERSQVLFDQRYLDIRPHLDKEVLADLQAQTMHVVGDPYGTVGNYYLSKLSQEADRLTREWKLP